MPDPAILAPGSTIGILGGGQLGRMLAVAAAELGFRTHIYCPDPHSPAFDVAAAHTLAPYEDDAALDRFAEAIDCATIEFENVPAAALDRIARQVPMRPGNASLRFTQDRLTERRFVESVGARLAGYHQIDRAEDLAGWDFAAGRAVMKTRRMGYDGKGQAIVGSLEEATRAFAELGAVPAILERHIAFRLEISAIVARAAGGGAAAFEPAENRHPGHILGTSRVPAAITPEIGAAAIDTATKIAAALDHVGVLAVEYFVADGAEGEELLVNEIAPRVHNSGHWTQDGASVSQFEQHIRAVAGWPLAAPVTLAPTVMTNLIGEDVAGWQNLAGEPGAHLHLYGKREARPGRKMGHVNRVASTGPGSGRG